MTASWFAPVDNYCERTGAGFWAEPLNALTNAAFLVAAALAYLRWRRAGGKDWPVLWLIGVTAAVGTGSFLFHTVAERWSILADVLPIAVFIYGYFVIAMRRYLGLGIFAASLATGLFAVFSLSFERLWLGLLPGLALNGSVGYLPAALALLAVGGTCLAKGTQRAGESLLLAAGIFVLSLTFRSVDEAVCAAMPTGTHLYWHLLNALVLWILMNAAITACAGAAK